jgi:hypothetical protein
MPIVPDAPSRGATTTGLPSKRAELLGERARDHVDAAAGGERHDQLHRLVGPCRLRRGEAARERGERDERSKGDRDHAELLAGCGSGASAASFARSRPAPRPAPRGSALAPPFGSGIARSHSSRKCALSPYWNSRNGQPSRTAATWTLAEMRDRAGRVVRRAQHAAALRRLADAQELGQPARVLHVGHDRVVRARVEKRREGRERGHRFAAGQAHADRVRACAEALERVDRRARLGERTLEPVQARRLEPRERLSRRALVEAPVAVDHEIARGADRLAHREHALEAEVEFATPQRRCQVLGAHVVERRDLDRAKAAVRRLARARRESRRTAIERAAVDVRIERDRRGAQRAERRGEQHALRLRGQVPHRLVDRAKRGRFGHVVARRDRVARRQGRLADPRRRVSRDVRVQARPRGPAVSPRPSRRARRRRERARTSTRSWRDARRVRVDGDDARHRRQAAATAAALASMRAISSCFALAACAIASEAATSASCAASAAIRWRWSEITPAMRWSP